MFYIVVRSWLNLILIEDVWDLFAVKPLLKDFLEEFFSTLSLILE